MKSMQLRQYKLISDGQILVAWLEDGRVKIGDFVKLKDTDEPERKWRIAEVYSAQDSSKIHDSHNSKDAFESIQGRGGKN